MDKLASCLVFLFSMPALAAAQTGDQADAVEVEGARPEGGAEVAPAEQTGAAEASSDQPPSSLEAEQASMRPVMASAEIAPVERERLDHEYQLGLRVGAGVPFVLALRYGGGTPCDAAGSTTFCPYVGQPIMDFDLSFGVTRDLEIDFMTRISLLGEEPTFSHRVLLGLGIRAYIEPQSIFKLFLGVRAVLDATPRGSLTAPWSDVDAGIRGEVGLQVDPVRYLGIYLQLGASILFVRAMQFVPDVTGGLQLRFP